MTEGINVANHILDHIVREGRNKIIDKSVTCNKMPVFIKQKVAAISADSVIHSGYQHQQQKRNTLLGGQKEAQPTRPTRDVLAHAKTKVQRRKVNKSAVESPNKSKQRSYSYSGLSSRKIKNSGFSDLKMDSRKQSQSTQCIKLEPDNQGRVVIERVQLRQSMEEDRLREQRKKALLYSYQEQKANELFEQQRLISQEQKQRKFNAHISRGQGHCFYLHQGEAVLYRKEDESIKKNYPKKTQFNVEADQFEAIQQVVQKPTSRSSHFFKKVQPKTVNEGPTFQQHHRIRSARGEAFASAVLKTINLSRISLNETLRNLEVEQFMKRNDLFNNNHSRQTTCIPYMEANSGTVYTQLSTNQMLGENKSPPEKKRPFSYKSESTRNPNSGRRKSHFEPFWNPDHTQNNKTERDFEEKDFREGQEERIDSRPIRTADAAFKRRRYSERRARTSVSKGRITTANENLAQVLLQ